MVEAAAGCRNLPKRVPVLANPHDGISMRKRSSESKIFRAVWDGIERSRLQVTRITSKVRGPWTPLIRVISISDVAEGPEIVVMGSVEKEAIWRMLSGTVSTICDGKTIQR